LSYSQSTFYEVPSLKMSLPVKAIVVIEDCYELSGAYKLQVALPEAVGVNSLPTPVGSLDSGPG
jgi:hypothetical protein